MAIWLQVVIGTLKELSKTQYRISKPSNLVYMGLLKSPVDPK